MRVLVVIICTGMFFASFGAALLGAYEPKNHGGRLLVGGVIGMILCGIVIGCAFDPVLN